MKIKLADLSPMVPLPSDDSDVRQTLINRDIAFLGSLLFYLATGKPLPRNSVDIAPLILHPLIEKAMQGQCRTVAEIVKDLMHLPSDLGRPLKPSHGQAVNVGKERDSNQDSIATFTLDKEQEGGSMPIGFYLVADGMGGYEAGDVASLTVNQIVTNWIVETRVLPDLRKITRRLATHELPGGLLVKAFEQANAALVNLKQAKQSELGSTITAALVIGDVVTIANVGDSRTYLLRGAKLEQITEDHSLVARLLETGVIEPDEVRTHPRRNEIYRCLGCKPTVEVDTFTVRLQRGDYLILCSDGLWEMVHDDEIQRLVEQSRSPQQACDALVGAANRAGGDDNIAVIVVEME